MDTIEIIVDLIKGIDKKINKLDERIDNVDKTLSKQEEQLAEHIRRTNLLEKKLEPVEDHVKYMHGALKLFGVISVVGGALFTLYKLLTIK